HTIFSCDWSSDVCSSDLGVVSRLNVPSLCSSSKAPAWVTANRVALSRASVVCRFMGSLLELREIIMSRIIYATLASGPKAAEKRNNDSNRSFRYARDTEKRCLWCLAAVPADCVDDFDFKPMRGCHSRSE